MSQYLLVNFNYIPVMGFETNVPQTLVCICCLSKNVRFINLSMCQHTQFLELLCLPEIRQSVKVVCDACHTELRKITAFREQVLKSYNILLSQTFDPDNTESVQIRKFMVKKTSDIHLPETVSTVLQSKISQKNKDVKKKTDLTLLQIDIEVEPKLDGAIEKVVKSSMLPDSSNQNEMEESNDTTQLEKDPLAEETNITCSVLPERKNKNETDISRNLSESKFHREKSVNKLEEHKKRISKKKMAILKKENKKELQRGPIKEECRVCKKMISVKEMEVHVKRHHNKTRFECKACDKVFIRQRSYDNHLKYSLAHATESVLCYPCPMCDKGFPKKQAMLDHFNYHHLGKTQHKCPICDKPIASEEGVKRHVMRLHKEKKQRSKDHLCRTCGKTFIDRKHLNQHEVIHTGSRPFLCNICQQTFKHKASLYTHRKNVHKVYPNKKHVEFMEKRPDCPPILQHTAANVA